MGRWEAAFEHAPFETWHARRCCHRRPQREHLQSAPCWLWDWCKSIAIAVLIWLVLRTFVIESFHIPSGSMENTLLVGDFLFVTKAVYGAEVPLVHSHLPAIREPRRGDIVVFRSILDGSTIVKRLVGLSGDTLAMRAGHLFRNGLALAEPYVLHVDNSRSETPSERARMRAWQIPHLAPGQDAAAYWPDVQDWGPIVLPSDSVFVMGDNRDNSLDSRYWGPLPRLNIQGQPLLIYFSYDPDSWRVLPFLTAIRWSRLLARPH